MNGSLNLAEMIKHPEKIKPKQPNVFKPGSPQFTDSPGFARNISIARETQSKVKEEIYNEDDELFGNLKPSIRVATNDGDSIFG